MKARGWWLLLVAIVVQPINGMIMTEKWYVGVGLMLFQIPVLISMAMELE
jgi:hypothetical protein